MTTQPAEHPAEADARHAVDVADAALALAGHRITDPVLIDIAQRFARGEITVSQATAEQDARLARHRRARSA